MKKHQFLFLLANLFVPVLSFPYFKPNWLSCSLKIHKQFTWARKHNIQQSVILYEYLLWVLYVWKYARSLSLNQPFPKPAEFQLVFINHFQSQMKKQFASKRDNFLFNLWVVSWSIPLKCIKYSWEWNTGINIGRYMKCTTAWK